MKKKHDVRSLLRKQVDKDAVVILNKVDRMLKRGVPRTKIEKALAAELSASLKKNIKRASEELYWMV